MIRRGDSDQVKPSRPRRAGKGLQRPGESGHVGEAVLGAVSQSVVNDLFQILRQLGPALGQRYGRFQEQFLNSSTRVAAS